MTSLIVWQIKCKVSGAAAAFCPAGLMIICPLHASKLKQTTKTMCVYFWFRFFTDTVLYIYIDTVSHHPHKCQSPERSIISSKAFQFLYRNTYLSQSRSAMICSATLRRDVLKTPDCVPAALGSALSDSIHCTVCRRWRPSRWKSRSQGHYDSVSFKEVAGRGDKNESDFLLNIFM